MKKRHYTLQQTGDSLCLTIKGKFLTQELGLQAGDYFQLISQDNQLILLKTPKEERSPSQAELDKLTREEKLHKRKIARLFSSAAGSSQVRRGTGEQQRATSAPAETGGRVADSSPAEVGHGF